MVEETKQVDTTDGGPGHTPQGLRLEEMIFSVDKLKSGMRTVQQNMVRQFAAKKVTESDNLQKEILSDCQEVSAGIARIRKKIIDNINNEDSMSGCLRGSVDDYIQSFEAQIDRLKVQFDANRDYWESKAEREDEKVNDQIMEAQALYEGFEKVVYRIFCDPGPNKTKIFQQKMGLKDLKNFGNPISNHKHNFRWPKKEDVESLGLEEPLRLVQIRTKGIKNSSLTAIQLIFDGGLETPFFDTFHARADSEIRTEDVSGKDIKRIIVNTGGYYIRKLQFEYEEGPQVIYDKNEGIDREEVREIPDNHHIVGVYGRMEPNSLMSYVGFIISEF